MESYTFDEGVAFLTLVKAPLGVIKHLQKTHNRSHLHSEIHKMLRLPRTKEILRKNDLNPETIAQPTVESTIERNPENTKEEGSAIEPKSDAIETKSDEIEPKSNEIEPKSDEIEPKSDNDTPVESTIARKDESTKEEDPDIILTIEDVRKHENTRLEDMPNELCRTLWLKRQEVYREMQQAHLKMRNVPEGEEHDEERAQYRADVLRLVDEVEDYWKQIDAEIERIKEEEKRADKNAEEAPAFNVSTYRSYICKALRKKKLSPEQFTELQHRVDALLKANLEIDDETIEKLKAIGISVG